MQKGMTYRPSDLPSRDHGPSPESRLNQQIRREGMAEGCPVIEEFGAVCGETYNLSVFHEFRKIYDNCFQKLEKHYSDPYILKKLAPFKKLIEDLWEQNAMLVETIEELEQEATSRVTVLQDKLNKSCQKLRECKEDINSLLEIIRRFSENGTIDCTGLQFYTITPPVACRKITDRSSVSKYPEKEDIEPDFCKSILNSSDPHFFCEAPSKDLSFPNSQLENLRSCEFGNFRQNISGSLGSCKRFFDNNVSDCSLREASSQKCVPQVNIHLNLKDEGCIDSTRSCCCDCICNECLP